MVEAVYEKRGGKFFWSGTKLPSMGCYITIFSFYGFYDQVKAMVYQLRTSGKAFFNKHLDNLVLIQDASKSKFLGRRFKYLKADQKLFCNFDTTNFTNLFVKGSTAMTREFLP